MCTLSFSRPNNHLKFSTKFYTTMTSSKADFANVNILFFAKAKELVKKSSLLVQLPSKFDNINDLLDKVEDKFPELRTLNRCFVLALNEDYLSEYKEMDTNKPNTNTQSIEIMLNDGDELAVIPPLCGGYHSHFY